MTATTQGSTTGTKSLSMVAAVNQALDYALGKDDKVFLMGEDVADPAGGVIKASKGLSTKYGTDRVRATPIAETGFVGAAIGASLAGYRPVVEVMIMDFFAVCMDQVANHAAKLRYMTGGRTNVPITIRTLAGGGGGFGAQHSQSLEGWMMHTPGLKVVVPSTPAEARGLLISSIFDDDPVVFMETMRLAFTTGPAPVEITSIPLGQADVKRPGADVSIITWGWEVPESLAAAEELAGEGISAEVVDLRSLVPLDRDAVLASVAKTKRALVVHSSVQFAGPGAEIAAMIQKELWGQLAGPVERLGASYAPVPFATDLENAYLPSRARIADVVRKMQ